MHRPVCNSLKHVDKLSLKEIRPDASELGQHLGSADVLALSRPYPRVWLAASTRKRKYSRQFGSDRGKPGYEEEVQMQKIRTLGLIVGLGVLFLASTIPDANSQVGRRFDVKPATQNPDQACKAKYPRFAFVMDRRWRLCRWAPIRSDAALKAWQCWCRKG